MSGQVYALFVGIDEYTPPVRPLGGCVNDIEAMATLLTSLVGDNLHPLTIRNDGATRENVIEAFRSHLGQAAKDDVALFCYSGHGSQEVASEEFWALEPDHYNETIVCVDSRTPGKRDLADKELQGLVAAVSTRGAEVLLILDCCHSGSGARALDTGDRALDQQVRQVEPDTRERPISEYDLSGETVTSLADKAKRSAGTRSVAARGWGALSLEQGESRYVLLAACDSSQTAKEQRVGDQRRGVFSVSLQGALRTTGGRLTYADLISWTTTRVRDLAADQTPQLESAVAEDGRRDFLGGRVDQRPYHRLAKSRQGWTVDAGLVHGVPIPVAGQPTVFAIFPMGDRAAGQPPITTATVESVEPDKSRVRISPNGGPLDEDTLYAAILQSWPVPPMPVAITGDPQAGSVLSAALTARGEVAEVTQSALEHAELNVVAGSGEYSIRRVADGRLVAQPVADVTSVGANRVMQQLDRIARWRRLRDLDAADAGLTSTDLRLDVREVDAADQPPSPRLRLAYDAEGNRPRVLAAVTNTSNKRLYVAMLGLSDRFGVVTLLHQTWGEWLDPGEVLSARGNRSIPLEVPDALWDNGITEVTDTIKVIASTQPFSAEALSQGELDAPNIRGERALAPVASTLDSMLRRSAARGFGDDDEPRTTVAAWGTASCTIVTHRPRRGHAVSRQGTEIAPGVVLTAPADVVVAARLVAGDDGAGDAGGRGTTTGSPPAGALPPLLRVGSTPVALERTRDVTDPPASLELSWSQDRPAISAANPITVRIPEGLADGESIVPFAWDGEFWLPVGRTLTRSEEHADIAIAAVPGEPEGTELAMARSLGGSIRILFRKLVGRKLGLSYSWPRLAVATVSADGSVNYDVDGVHDAVQNARRVLLYVHGIIGDTAGMVRAGADHGLTQGYDLTLAFDYENINTSIEQTAKDLGNALHKAGFEVGAGPPLDIVAHSMGGLVSRWYIEREGGNGVVDKLVTVGTPHRGSPWPQIQDWATAAMGIGLNGLGLSAFWPAAILGGLAQIIERYDDALDQMKADSPLVQQLSTSPDPDIPYHLIAGDRSVTAAGRTQSLLRRLRFKVWTTVDALAFLGDPNDIAVTVDSATAVPTGWTPVIAMVGCDHMTYFDSDSGVAALRAALSARD